MFGIFLSLALLSVLVTIVAIIKPSIYRAEERGQAFLRGALIFLVFIILGLIVAPETDEQKAERLKAEVEAARQDSLAALPMELKWVEEAAHAEHPLGHLNELWAASVLPETDKVVAWSMAEKFTKQALKGSNTNYLFQTVNYPWYDGSSIKADSMAVIEEATGRYLRYYTVSTEFDVKNEYNAEVRLRSTIHMYTADNEDWKAYQVYVSDPRKRPLLSGIVTIENDAWEGRDRAYAPDSLLALLDERRRELGHFEKAEAVLDSIKRGRSSPIVS